MEKELPRSLRKREHKVVVADMAPADEAVAEIEAEVWNCLHIYSKCGKAGGSSGYGGIRH